LKNYENIIYTEEEYDEIDNDRNIRYVKKILLNRIQELKECNLEMSRQL